MVTIFKFALLQFFISVFLFLFPTRSELIKAKTVVVRE